MTILISASILSADFSNLAREIHESEKAGIDWIHIDVMDGHFVPNLTMGPFIVKTCQRITQLPLDCHLMVNNPETLINAFTRAGASTITIHPENNPNVLQTIQAIKSAGCNAGLSLKPETPAAIVTPLLPFIDLIMIMTVNPGYSGQLFMPEMVDKIAEVKSLIDQHPNVKYLQVDGGINQNTIQQVVKAGANCIVAATAIFGYPTGITEGVNSLRMSLG
jgi:ribulose-phosphate 3-epimerase